MRVFVTGASGFIGSAVVPELIAAGHRVVGLARSDASAKAVAAAGAEVVRGDLNDVESLKKGAHDSDGIVHLGFIHDFSNMPAALETDRVAMRTFADVFAGSDRPVVFASGLIGVTPEPVVTEDAKLEATPHPRVANAVAALALAQRGVRVSAVRLAPTTHGQHDHGFVATLAAIAREKGVSGYIGDGANLWPAVHRSDAARLFRLALEKAEAGAILHAVAEEGIATKTIAEMLGEALAVPVSAIAPEKAAAHFGWISRFFSLGQRASSAITQKKLAWKPTGPTLKSDIENGFYGKAS